MRPTAKPILVGSTDIDDTSITILEDNSKSFRPIHKLFKWVRERGIPITVIVFILSALMIVIASVSVWAIGYRGAIQTVDHFVNILEEETFATIVRDLRENLDNLRRATNLIKSFENHLMDQTLPDDANSTYNFGTLLKVFTALKGQQISVVGLSAFSTQPRNYLSRNYWSVVDHRFFAPPNEEDCPEPHSITLHQDSASYPFLVAGCYANNGTYIRQVGAYNIPVPFRGASNPSGVTRGQFSEISGGDGTNFVIGWKNPVFWPNGSVYGAAYAQKSFDDLDDYLVSTRLGEIGAMFLVERSTGLLISTSVTNYTLTYFNGTFAREFAVDSPDTLIRESARYLIKKLGTYSGNEVEYDGVDIDGDSHIVAMKPFEFHNLEWAIVMVIPESYFIGNIRESVKLSAVFSVVILVVSVGLTFVWTRFIVRPLSKLAVSMQKITRMEFDANANDKSAIKEIRAIQRSFSAMRKGVESFSKYVPISVVKGLLRGQHNAELGVRPQFVTIMFIDLKGFTTLCEDLPAHKTAHILGDFLTIMTNVIISHQGTVDKYIGDCVMAFWNAPEEVTDHQFVACCAALECYRALNDLYQEKWLAQGYPKLEMRIGLHCAEVLVGNIGSPERMNYTVIGDGVNLASRMESLGKDYDLCGTLMTEEVYNCVRDRFIINVIDEVAVKGRTQSTKVYQLVCTPEMATTVELKTAEIYRNLYSARKKKSSGLTQVGTLCEQLSSTRQSNPTILKLLQTSL